jgi:hypothetical protein
LIPQPPIGELAVAPDSERVDLQMPSFSDPTVITNPLFPVSAQASVLFLGHVDGKPFRTEVTLLPFPRVVTWEGLRVEAAVSQYAAYLDGRLQEVAYDLYAQADDGSVWYLGEDVADLADGSIVTKEGTWLAGKDAPGAMIMPARPAVGDAFRTENSPGFAFEEVTVKTVDQVVDGPLGPIPGGLIVSELHMDGSREDKTFAPGYGEFLTTDGVDVEALAMAVPTDGASGPVPEPIDRLTRAALGAFDAATAGQWDPAARQAADAKDAWSAVSTAEVPRLIGPQVQAGLLALQRTVAARDAHKSRQAALDLAQSGLDLQLRYRDPADIAFDRLDLWAAQLILDADRKDAGAVNGDVFTLMYQRDRILGSLERADQTAFDSAILALQQASFDGDLPACVAVAAKLHGLLARH